MLSQLLLQGPRFWSACSKLLTITTHRAQRSQWHAPHVLPLAHPNTKAKSLISPWKKLVYTSCMSTFVAAIWRPQITQLWDPVGLGIQESLRTYWTNRKPVSNGHARTSCSYPLGLSRGSRQKHLYLSFSLEKIWIHTFPAAAWGSGLNQPACGTWQGSYWLPDMADGHISLCLPMAPSSRHSKSPDCP